MLTYWLLRISAKFQASPCFRDKSLNRISQKAPQMALGKSLLKKKKKRTFIICFIILPQIDPDEK